MALSDEPEAVSEYEQAVMSRRAVRRLRLHGQRS
jgi:hypothetical protein